jgi:hypothetical protein
MVLDILISGDGNFSKNLMIKSIENVLIASMKTNKSESIKDGY